MSEIWWFRASRDVVAIGGADAVNYLQGQVSQDVASMAPGTSVWSLVLAPQGKVDALFRLHALDGGDFIADTDAGAGPRLIERLERFRLRVDVTIETLPWQFVAVRGAGVAAPERPEGGLVAEVTWPDFEGFDLLGPAVSIPADAVVVTPENYEYHRIAAGWPVMDHELTDTTIPAEAGIVDLTVSFTKGCFTGQELVARIDSRGNNTPRRLCRLRVDGPDPLSVGAELIADGSAVGTVTSAAADPAGDRSVGLAYVHRSVDLPATLTVEGRVVTALGR